MARGVRMIFQTGRRVTTPGCGGHMDGECCPPGSAAPLRGRRFGKVSRDSTPPIITFGTVKLPRRLTNFVMARGRTEETGRRVRPVVITWTVNFALLGLLRHCLAVVLAMYRETQLHQ